MKTARYAKLFFAALAAVSLALLSASCDWDAGETGEYKVAAGLRGLWERTEPAVWPEGQSSKTEKGRLKLDYDTITIHGPVAHLQGFTRDTRLEAYTEDDALYIKDRGVWQSPVQYTRWQSGGSFPHDKMLTLKGGGVPDETLKRAGESTNPAAERLNLTHRNTLGSITEALTAKVKKDIGFERYHGSFLSGFSFFKPFF